MQYCFHTSIAALLSFVIFAEENTQPCLPEFTMVTLSTPNRAGFADMVEKNQRVYARRHGYGYVKFDRSLDPSRPEEWSKIKALLEVLNDTNPCWLLWIDDDIIITDPQKPLTYFTDKYGHGKDLIIARDAEYQRGVPFNNGIFLLRNSPWSREFLKNVWQEGPKRSYLVRGKSLLEQQTMTDLINENALDAAKSIIINQREINSFLRSPFQYPNDPPESKWQPGDFAAHVTGMALEQRRDIIKELLTDSYRVPATMVAEERNLQNKLKKQEAEKLVQEHILKTGTDKLTADALRDAALQGDPVAQLEAAVLSLREGDEEGAKFYLNLARLHGVGQAGKVLDHLPQVPNLRPLRSQEDECSLKLAADAGDPKAMLDIGLIYSRSNNKEKEARSYLNRASENGVMVATAILKNSDKQEHLLKFAADTGDANAQYQLGWFYLTRARNSEAEHYFSLALHNGVELAEIMLGIAKN